MRHIDQNEVIRFSKSRAMMETFLCKRMYEEYDKGEIRSKLRSFIRNALESICVLATSGTLSNEIHWTGAIREAGKNLAVWRHGGGKVRVNNINNLKLVLRNSGQWTASDCSDLIRLFGGIIEDPVLQKYGEISPIVDKFRTDQRFGRGFIDKGPEIQRARDKLGDGYYFSSKGNPQPTKLPHIAAAHNTVLRQKREKGFSGFEKSTLLDCSTIKKIDAAFGLAEGCDISGTTADSIFFMKYINEFFQGVHGNIDDDLMPVVQLLPMATMASQGHHTILECAATLTLNRLIRYRIGFYSTLIPANTMMFPKTLEKLFYDVEHSTNNRHILCYWDGNQLRGIHYNTYNEIEELRKACLVNGAFRYQFHTLPIKPTSKELFQLPAFWRLPH
jgi:hypothetical protein